MRETVFDESYNVREVLDDVIERVALREKLLGTAKQFAEKKREEKFTLAIRQFEGLMVDFLRLYQPILERLRSYREAMQKEITSLRSSLATVNGMLEVSKGIEGLATRVQQLEADGQELDGRWPARSTTCSTESDPSRPEAKDKWAVTRCLMFSPECRRTSSQIHLNLRKKLLGKPGRAR